VLYFGYVLFSVVKLTGKQTEFGLMIGFIGLFDTARDYTLQITATHNLVSLFALLGSGFQQRSVLSFRVQTLLSSLAGTFQLQLLSCTNWLPTV
jgi:hypothetical protein